jgi:hypothetical protein
MGWSISVILANEREPGYFGTFPEHDPVRAREIVEKLGIHSTNRSVFSDFNIGLNPKGGWYSIGAYPGGALVAGAKGLVSNVENVNSEFIARFTQVFPNARVLAMELVSATGYFAYVLYDKKMLTRMFCGDAERGIVIDIGERLTEESAILNVNRVSPPLAIGEMLAFAVSKTFFGVSLDKYPAERLMVELMEERGAVSMFLKSLLPQRMQSSNRLPLGDKQ